MNFLISLLLITFEMAAVFGLNSISMRFKLFQYDGSQNFKFSSNFESMFLSESHKTNRQTFSILKCLSLSLKNSSIKAITYDVKNDSTFECKLYSPSVIEFTDLMPSTDTIKVYLSNDITISSSTTSTASTTSTLISSTTSTVTSITSTVELSTITITPTISTSTTSITTTTKLCKIEIFLSFNQT